MTEVAARAVETRLTDANSQAGSVTTGDGTSTTSGKSRRRARRRRRKTSQMRAFLAEHGYLPHFPPAQPHAVPMQHMYPYPEAMQDGTGGTRYFVNPAGVPVIPGMGGGHDPTAYIQGQLPTQSASSNPSTPSHRHHQPQQHQQHSRYPSMPQAQHVPRHQMQQRHPTARIHSQAPPQSSAPAMTTLPVNMLARMEATLNDLRMELQHERQQRKRVQANYAQLLSAIESACSLDDVRRRCRAFSRGDSETESTASRSSCRSTPRHQGVTQSMRPKGANGFVTPMSSRPATPPAIIMTGQVDAKAGDAATAAGVPEGRNPAGVTPSNLLEPASLSLLHMTTTPSMEPVPDSHSAASGFVSVGTAEYPMYGTPQSIQVMAPQHMAYVQPMLQPIQPSNPEQLQGQPQFAFVSAPMHYGMKRPNGNPQAAILVASSPPQ
uniref:Uncharacterized protein n=2 Tax=Lotharella globosa TaxID=91324 RepID=A0A7S4DTY6_9EUKA